MLFKQRAQQILAPGCTSMVGRIVLSWARCGSMMCYIAVIITENQRAALIRSWTTHRGVPILSLH